MTDAADLNIKRFRKTQAFFERNRNLFTSHDAYRKQLERRHLNGLAASGAVIETSLGLMIDPERFQVWLLQPGARVAEAAESRRNKAPTRPAGQAAA